MKATIIFLGVFHFANPGLDAVRVDQIDVLSPASQAYLDDLSTRLGAFEPSVLLLEIEPEDEESVNQQYREYLEGNLQLGPSELYQLGFRIAKAAGLEQVHGMDEPGPPMKFAELMAYMESSEPAALKSFNALLADITEDEQQAHASLTLRELLLRTNDPEQDRRNKAIYLSTNVVGAGTSFVGADAAAAWWNRNFRMYANIQRHATPGTRILVIAGQGHTAILKDLAASDTSVRVEDAHPYLVP